MNLIVTIYNPLNITNKTLKLNTILYVTTVINKFFLLSIDLGDITTFKNKILPVKYTKRKYLIVCFNIILHYKKTIKCILSYNFTN